MAEAQSVHRQKMEGLAEQTAIEDMRREYQEARVGQISGLFIALSIIGAATYVAVNGHPWPGAALGGGGISVQAVVGLFIRGRKQHSTSETKNEHSALSKINKGSGSKTGRGEP